MGHFFGKVFTILDITWLTYIGVFLYNFFATAGDFAIRHESAIRLTQSTLLFVVGITYGYYRTRYYKRLWDNNELHKDDTAEGVKNRKKWWEFFK